jgi:hypothetical protein
MSQAMVSLTTLYQDFFVQRSCHIIDKFMGKWVKICSMTSAFVKEEIDGPIFCIQVFGLWALV